MSKSVILIPGILALVFLITNIILSINIVNRLNEAGEKTDLRWLRFKAFGYAHRYKEIKIKESGKPDMLYYLFVSSSFLFFATLLIGIILVYLKN